MIVFYKFLFFLINLLLLILSVVTYPLIYLVSRLYSYSAALWVADQGLRNCILFHAASVGEVNALKPLLKSFQNKYPQEQIVITTNTVAGLETARKIEGKVACMLAPIDLLPLRLRQMRMLKPKLICIVETEIWFNLLYSAKLYKVPIVFVNARLSPRSLKRFIHLEPLLSWLGTPIQAICAQSEQHRLRFEKLFDLPVTDCGNLKYAVELPLYDAAKIREELHYLAEDFIICFGSSRPGEEELILNLLPMLAREISNLKLILAVRHLNRMEEIKKLLEGNRYSLESEGSIPQQIHVVDKLGLLNKYYSICDIAIVGGSFFDFGGHNPLEPAFYAKPIIIGEFNRSCLDSVQKLNDGGGIVVSEVKRLADDVLSLYKDETARIKMGKSARHVLTENANSLDHHLQQIEQILEKVNA